MRVLRVIGSPFISGVEIPKNRNDARCLYRYAVKNKIGLLYLESLRNRGKIKQFDLESQYKDEKRNHNEQLITIHRISKVLNRNNVNYAIFKSIMPFPATPNDVDMIHFGSDEEYQHVADLLLRSGYREIEGYVDAEQRMFHDMRICEHLNLHEKDVYDIDIYQKISASYILYLDKNKIKRYVIDDEIQGHRIRKLAPEAELAAIIIHSLIPEMLFTLFVYYATLYYIAQMNSEEIDRFINIIKENNIIFAVKTHFSLVAELHKKAHGVIPERIEKILMKLGDNSIEKKHFIRNNLKMPHRYNLLSVLKILLEKMSEEDFMKSICVQVIHMINPLLIGWVIYNVILRLKRETY